jgi:hypothetical protein
MNNKDNKFFGALIGIFGLMLIFIVIGSFYIGFQTGKHTVRIQAVEQEVAEWESDKTGQVTFKWKEETK